MNRVTPVDRDTHPDRPAWHPRVVVAASITRHGLGEPPQSERDGDVPRFGERVR